MTEEIINYRIEYDVRGIDQSVRSTQRLLYFMNATRLAVVDLQQVMSGPTISNVMWTAVQLTRVWTHLYRLIKATNQAQRVGVAQTLGGTAISGAGGVAARRFAMGQGMLQFGAGGALGVGSAQTSLWATMMGFAAANPYVLGAATVGVVISGAALYDYRQRRMREQWVLRQREIAKNQGLEY